MPNYPADPAVRKVYQLLAVARNHPAEMIDLRKRLREVDKGIHLTQASLENGQTTCEAPTGYRGFRQWHAIIPTEKLLAAYRQRATQIDERICCIQREFDLVSQLLDDLEEMQRRIITMRWIDNRNWQQVARKLYISPRTGQRAQQRAILQMARKLESIQPRTPVYEAAGRTLTDSDNRARENRAEKSKEASDAIVGKADAATSV